MAPVHITLAPELDPQVNPVSPLKINVAVVDDDESFACALGRLFRASGFDVRTYPSAEAFLACPPQPQPDCLVFDVQLGGMSGVELQHQLRAAGDTVPIIFVTAHDAPAVRTEAERAGCAAYFPKPVSRATIIEAVRHAAQPVGYSPRNDPANHTKTTH